MREESETIKRRYEVGKKLLQPSKTKKKKNPGTIEFFRNDIILESQILAPGLHPKGKNKEFTIFLVHQNDVLG